MIIGVTGKIGSGKSYIAKGLAEKLNCNAINVDKVAHSLYQDENSVAYRQLVGFFGSLIVGTKGIIDRVVLGQLVFGETEHHKTNLKVLNAITHPLIEDEVMEILHHYIDIADEEHVIIDMPMLLNNPTIAESCDIIIVVNASERTRFERIKNRNPFIPESQIRKRMKIQNTKLITEDKFGRVYPIVLVDNDGTDDIIDKVFNHVK